MDIQGLIDEYAAWLREKITFEKFGEYYEITTPYLDNSNDYLQIYVKRDGEEIYFTDDCATIRNLKASGFNFTQARKAHLKRILDQYGIKLNGDELFCKAPANKFAPQKHMFIQAILRVDDMFIASRANASSFFLDDLQAFFDEKEIYYSDNVQFTGISGLSHNYDFLLQRSRTKPERLCQAVNRLDRSKMSNILFAWYDTKPARKSDSQLIVIFNDHNSVSKKVEDGLLNYDVKVVRWSERNKQENLDLFLAS